MTPDRALHRDDRDDIEGLTHRARIILPDVILPDGTASPHQVAVVPPGVSLAKAVLPHREIDGPVSTWTGAAIVGTREPDFAAYVDGYGSAIVMDDAAHRHITRPQSGADILRWLYDITGIRYAPAAFWKVAGWEIGWAANWLEGLYASGPMAELIVAARQAAAAVRAAWIVQRQGNGSSLAGSGVVQVARATIDMVRAFHRVVEEGLRGTTNPKHRENARMANAAIAEPLRSCVAALEAAAQPRLLHHDRQQKIASAIEHARRIVEAVGLFTVVGETIGLRVIRITDALPIRGRPKPLAPAMFADELQELADRVERPMAGIPTNAPPSWSGLLTGDLSRLQNPDPQARIDLLARVRTDLVYKLVVTRRLDRVFEALPWMAAPCGAFPLTFGGPLGAMASLFEVARVREIGLELKRRLFDAPGGPRLDARRGRREFADPVKVSRALRLGTRAGFLLGSSALSHHMVQALLAGRYFDPTHPLPTLVAGRLNYDFATAMQDPATMTTASETELAKPIYTAATYHRDLPVYMGLMLSDLLSAPLVDTFPGGARDPGINRFAALADARRRKLSIGSVPLSVADAGPANRELVRSMLKSLDTPTDGRDDAWRTAGIVMGNADDVELGHFDARHARHVGKRDDHGGAVRRRASKIHRARGPAGRSLERLVDQARIWPGGKGKAVADDRPLVAVLTGRKVLPGLTPVAQTFIPALWFRPGIDTHIHAWIAAGSPMWTPLALGNVVHAGLIAREVQAVGTAMPRLFGMPIPAGLQSRILVPMWTGLAGITADHAHVR